MAQRLAGRVADEALAALVYRRTEGHPLFMVQVTDYLAQPYVVLTGAAPSLRGAPAIERAVPERLRALVEAQLERLTVEEQHVLEVASVAGAEFVVASVAAGAQTTADGVEGVCERLAGRGQFIEDRGVARWPDGTVGGRYAFRHALYQDVLYERLGPGQRARLHAAIGQRLEAGYGERAPELAVELATHFERGEDTVRAIAYRHQAAQRAMRRHAPGEAISHVAAGLVLLERRPDSPARDRLELPLQMALGVASMTHRGLGAPEVGRAYARAADLCRRTGDGPTLFGALSGLCEFSMARAELRRVKELANELELLATREAAPVPS